MSWYWGMVNNLKAHLRDSCFHNYLLSILYHLLLPLLPCGLELWITKSITDKSLFITASIYSITIGNDSNYKLLFGISIFVSIIFAFCYGWSMRSDEALAYSTNFANIAILFLFCSAAVEKYGTYVIKRSPYWEFGKAGEGDA